MKTITRHTIYLLIAFLISSCYSSKKHAETRSNIMPLSDTVTLREGSLVYSLPRTVFTVIVGMERTTEKPGPYARYAGDLLGLNNVIQNESEFWSIEGITVRTHEELDPSEFYIIESTTLFQTNVLALKKEGLILDINPGIFYPAEGMGKAKEPEINQYQSFDLGSDEYFQQLGDTVYKRLKVDSTFIRIPYLVEKKRKLSVDQLAERAAKRLLEMREGKHLILTGEANVFPQSEAAINEMNRLEKEYTELFSGKSWKETRTFSYQIIPEKEMAGKPITLFHFSELTGPVTGTTKGGIPVTIELIPEQKTKDLTIIKKQQTEPIVPMFDKLFFRVPDIVSMKISLGPEVLFNSRRLVYQFGEIMQLPSNYVIGK